MDLAGIWQRRQQCSQKGAEFRNAVSKRSVASAAPKSILLKEEGGAGCEHSQMQRISYSHAACIWHPQGPHILTHLTIGSLVVPFWDYLVGF